MKSQSIKERKEATHIDPLLATLFATMRQI